MENYEIKKNICIEDEICPICLKNKSPNSQIYSCLRCHETYHINCIKKLVQYNFNKCPTCRYDANEGFDEFCNLIIFTRDIILYQNTIDQFVFLINILKGLLYFLFLIIISMFTYIFIL